MEFQARGSDVWERPVDGDREDLDSWTTYIPEANNVSQRRRDSPSAAFNAYSNLTFGYEHGNVSPPWYLPTFNTESDSPITAAAGYARDLAPGAFYQRATHPGTGEANYWSQGESYTNTGQWPGQTITRETAQNMYQDRAPITLSQWEERYDAYQGGQSNGEDLIGNFWVMDEADGWAYYAIPLQAGEATSYLLDASHMTQEVHDFQGSYYYGVHVKSELIGTPPDMATEMNLQGLEQRPDIPRFQGEPADVGFDGALGHFLGFVRMIALDSPNIDLPDFLLEHALSWMTPGRRFTTSGEQFLYLGEVEPNEHMIIRNRTLKGPSWNEQPAALATWYAGLSEALKARVQPVVIPARDAVPSMSEEEIYFGAHVGWIPINPPTLVVQDLTRVNQQGTRQAFALSMADVVFFSATSAVGNEPNIAFPNPRSRMAGDEEWWFTRTPADPGAAWGIDNGSNIGLGAFAPGPRALQGTNGGVRPALIIKAGFAML